MAVQSNLEIRIRALISGLTDVQKFVQELGKLTTEAADIGAAAATAGLGLTKLTTVSGTTADAVGKVTAATDGASQGAINFGTAAASATASVTKLSTDLAAVSAAALDSAANLGKVSDSTGKAATGAAALGASLGSGVTATGRFSEGLTKLSTSAGSAETGVLSLATAAAKGGVALESVEASALSAATGAKSFGTAFTSVASTTVKLGTNLQSVSQQALSSATGLKSVGAAADFTTKGITSLNAAVSTGAPTTIKYGESLTKLAQGATQAANGLADVPPTTQELADSAKAAGNSTDKLSAALEKAGESGGKGKDGLSEFSAQADTLKKSTNELVGLLKSAAIAFAGFLAIKGAQELATKAATIETLGITLGIVGRNAGYSQSQLDGFEKSLKKLGITTAVSREALTRMIQTGLDLNSVNEKGANLAAQLARAAQDLAVVTGENSSETLNRLITNISQLDTMGLRYQGITVNTEAAMARFAATIGKTSDQLTQQQKIQAFANATLAEASKLTGAYEAAIDSTGKKIQSLTRYQEEAGKVIGDILKPAYGVLIDAATDLLKTLEKVGVEVETQGVVSARLANIVTSVVAPLSDLFKELITTTADLAPAIAAIGEVLGTFAGAVFGTLAAVVSLSRESGALTLVITTLGVVIAGLQDGLTVISTFLASLGVGFLRLAQITFQAGAAIAAFFGIETDNSAIAQALKEQADAAQEAVDRNVASFARGETALQKYSDSLDSNAKLVTKSAAEQTAAYKSTDASITALVGQISQGKLTAVEAAAATDSLAKAVAKLGADGDLTGKQVLTLTERLKTLDKEALKKTEDSIAALGLSMQKLGTTEFLAPLNKEFGVTSANLTQLANAASVTGQNFTLAFANGIDTAKSVQDIAKLADILKDADLAGKDTAESFSLLGVQFSKVFNEELKTAKTRTEFDLLKAKVEETAKAYPALKELALQALDAINTKSKQTGASALELAKQATEAQKLQTAAITATLAVARAEIDVTSARRGVSEALNALAREGTALNSAKYDLAKQELALAEALAVQARAKAAADQQNYTVQIAQQKQLNLEKAVSEGKASKESAVAGQLKLEQAQLQLEKLQQQEGVQQEVVEKQRVQVEKLKEAVAAQDSLVNKTKDQKDAQEGATQSAAAAVQSYTSLVPLVGEIDAKLKSIGFSTEAASESSKRLFRELGQGGVGSSIDDLWAGIGRVNKSLDEAVKKNAQLTEQAKQVTEQYALAKQAAAEGVSFNQKMSQTLANATDGARALAAAYQQVKADARAAAQSALDSAKSFSAAALSISQELLSAQGNEEAAIKSKSAARKEELAVQYELLKVQIQIAIAAGKAAKVDTSALENSLTKAAENYKKAQKDLDTLEKINLDKQTKAKADALQKEKADAARAEKDKVDAAKESADRILELQKQLATAQGKTDEARALERKQNLDGLSAEEAAIQQQIDAANDEKDRKTREGEAAQAASSLIASSQASAARATSVPAVSPQSIAATSQVTTPSSPRVSGVVPPEAQPVKKIEVRFTNGTNSVNALIDVSDESRFLTMLAQAKKVT